VQLELNLTAPTAPATGQVLYLDAGCVPVIFKRNPRARRYILRLDRQGRAQVTIPRRGSAAEAREFTENNKAWLERQLRRLAREPKHPSAWPLGSEILLRGEFVRIEAGEETGTIRLGTALIRIKAASTDLRPELERHLRKVAAQELPPRVFQLAATHQLQAQHVSVRDQRSRWGSCSRRGTISLNWRLLQAPQFVSDYIILHELMHLRQMNHSKRFWREVKRVCPDYQIAERWLKQHSHLLTQA
jgi:predicted metal-dependent hydrolase